MGKMSGRPYEHYTMCGWYANMIYGVAGQIFCIVVCWSDDTLLCYKILFTEVIIISFVMLYFSQCYGLLHFFYNSLHFDSLKSVT